MLRRYSAKIAYEVELHAPGADLERDAGALLEPCSASGSGSPWPRETWLSDVDSSFYVACYLRAWALEVDWRAELAEQLRGPTWFANREAGEWLRGTSGRRASALDGEVLLAEATGGALDFERLASELVGV